MNSGAHGFRTSLRALTFTKLRSTRRLTTLPGAGLRRNNRNWTVLLKASLGLRFFQPDFWAFDHTKSRTPDFFTFLGQAFAETIVIERYY